MPEETVENPWPNGVVLVVVCEGCYIKEGRMKDE
jgi:hypothetical protein